ncbi:MAG: preprotein translocase subunit YajC [Lachnospiraceae bacterium]|nr:preprotein translocase subunit YajC [Lachnospiraceae bacterium]
MGQQAAEDGTESKGTSWYVIVIYLVIFGAIVYFLMIRPQRKQKKQQEERTGSLEPGDSVLTTSGFYGTIVAINGDTVIVEFGNNKNCRIPMSKQAISQVEKANAQPAPVSAQPEKKFFGRKKAQEEAPAPVEQAAEAAKETVAEAAETVEAVKETAAEAVEAVAEAAEEVTKE